MESNSIKKLYYSIGEVSQITSIKKYVLRYWESEFTVLNPSKNSAGNRTYTLDNIKTIFLIKRLLYEEKFTLEGARAKLTQMQGGGVQEQSLDDLRKEDSLIEVKKDLHGLLAFLDNADLQELSEQDVDTDSEKEALID